jgi:putative ABC transport system ATP-binding protein
MSLMIQMKGIKKFYDVGDVVVKALQGMDLSVERGEFAAIMGASGSGKSTLMNIIGCLDSPTEGEYVLDGVDVNALSKDEFADVRNLKIGFVFQVFNLLSRTSALENVELPLFYDRTDGGRDPRDRAMEALDLVGLGDRIHHTPNQLSGGQRQRVAIARALVNDPSIVLADEPTGNLDSLTSVDIMALFQDLNDNGITVVLVTHEPDIARYAKRIITLQDGRIVRDIPVKSPRRARIDVERLKEEKEKLENGDGVLP